MNVMIKSCSDEAVIDAVVGPLQGAAPVITALPARAAVRGRLEDASIMIVEADAHDTPVIPGIHPVSLMALAHGLCTRAP